MKKTHSRKRHCKRIARRHNKALIPLVAAGGSLAALPAGAIELGEAVVESHLGQPLRASIAYALAPNEQISNTCVSVGRTRSATGLPGIGRADITITDRAIVLSGQAALREPMVSATLVVNCPYTPNLAREYMMFIDPASPTFESQPVVAATEPAARPAATSRPATQPSPALQPAIGPSTRYQVQPGDSLSEIAQRIENRPVKLWAAVNAIFAANPDAFMGNDPNRLKAGSWLKIPSFDGSEPVVAASSTRAVQPSTAVSQAPAAQAAVYDPAAVEDVAQVADETVDTAAAEEPLADSAFADTAVTEVAPPVAIEPVADPVTDSTQDLRPGDIILDADLEGPESTATTPNVPTATIDTSSAADTPARDWTWWFAGGGIAVLLALVLLGRRFRDQPTPEDFATADEDAGTESLHAYADDEYDLDDDSPTAENLALDADLLIGTGLAESTDMEVAEDFGFAAPTEVDIELPFEPMESSPTMETDIIPPVNTDEQSILDSEILPDDDDYDMSVIVDATKMPQPEDVTERDLKAVEVEPFDDTDTTDNYTINREPDDFDMLEKDYEDELTATQALNREIQRAAEELAESMEQDEDVTSEMPLATVTELDVTAQLPRSDDDVDDEDPTTSNEAMSDTDKTVEMSGSGSEDTVEMDVEGGKVDTRAG